MMPPVAVVAEMVVAGRADAGAVVCVGRMDQAGSMAGACGSME